MGRTAIADAAGKAKIVQVKAVPPRRKIKRIIIMLINRVKSKIGHGGASCGPGGIDEHVLDCCLAGSRTCGLEEQVELLCRIGCVEVGKDIKGHIRGSGEM